MSANKWSMRIIKLTLTIMVLCIIAPVTVYANSPAPADYIDFEITNKSDNCVFADILIKINSDCPEYVEFNSLNGTKFGISADSHIAIYNEDGFMSFTFHYNDAISDMRLKTKPQVNSSIYTYHYASYVEINNDDSQFNNLLNNYHVIKIALLDEHGNILTVTDEIDINPEEPGFFAGLIKYDADNGQTNSGYYVSPYFEFFIGFINIFLTISVILRIAVSITIESLLAIPFKVKPVWKIICVNILTQIILVIFMTLCDLPYMQSLIIIELIVYFSEFFIYIMILKNISKLRLILYTPIANTGSLIVGILLNTYRIFETL